MERREFGNTGEKLSLIGLGGIVVTGVEQSEADRIVAEAVDRGVNYFDVGPAYGDAEERLGPALQPYRDKVFLACKTTARDKEGAARELENSLRLLRTDHFDLYQHHGFNAEENAADVFAPGGAMETFEEAQRAGKVRFLGLSSHSPTAVEVCMQRYSFTSALFPVNFVCWFQGFGPQMVKATKAGGGACLALKAMARGPWPEGDHKWAKCWYQPIDNREHAGLALRWTLSQEVTAAIPPGEPELFRMALDIAEKFRPITSEEVDKLREMARELKPIMTLTGRERMSWNDYSESA